MSNLLNRAWILTIFFIFSCSSIQKISEDENIASLIKKPDFNYNVTELPKKIHLYSLKESGIEQLSEEFRGFAANSYFSKSNLAYEPEITFKALTYESCELENIKKGFIVLFDLEVNSSQLKQNCLLKFKKLNTFYVSKANSLGFVNKFIISRNSERKKLIETIPSKSKTLSFVSSNKDEVSIEQIISSKKIISNIASFDDSKNSQDLFSEILLTKRSDDRKRKLSRRLSKTLIGDLRSRDDLDAFFFSVSLKEARNLKPALDFLSENKFDLYLLNSWEEEESYLLRDKDLIGTVNADIPMMMPIELPDFLTESSRNRSFAIGFDAFEIVLIKYGLNTLKGINYRGLTGKITFSGGEIIREPYIFKITEGGYEIL